MNNYGYYKLRLVTFFFQAEAGIRGGTVTGVQTCALPIYRDEQAVEDLRMPAHRLGQEQAAFDVRAQLLHHQGEVLVVGLLLEDHQRGDDVQAGLDHGRELPREDLEGLRLDLLEDVSRTLVARGRQLVQGARQQASDTKLLPCSRQIGRMEL